MTTIVLTQAQIEAITTPATQKFKADLVVQANDHARKVKALQRAANAKVDRANQRCTDWKLQYTETRKLLLLAQGEIVTLKRRIRNAEWEN